MSFDVEVSLALGADITADPSTWSWTDITSYCMIRTGGVKIRRGRADEQSAVAPASCEVLVNNGDGRFSRLNPSGAYYGQLKKNTPLRVRACATGGSLTTRFVGFISELPPRWEATHHWVPIRAAGVLRRLGQGGVTKSALYRTVLAADPAGYWPMEDGAEATIVGSAIPEVAAMTVQGTANFASTSGPPGSGPLCDGLLADEATFYAPTVVNGSDFQISFVFRAGSTATAAGVVMSWEDPTSATERFWTVTVDSTEGGQVSVAADDIGDTLGPAIATSDTGTVTFGEFYHCVFRQESDGTRSLFLNDVDYGGTAGASGPPRNLQVTPSRADLITPQGEISFGHLAIWADSSTDAPGHYEAMLGYAGEQADDRFARLCTEEGVAYDVTLAASSPRMGAQPIADILPLLRNCEAAGEALVVERKTGELGFDNAEDRQNATVSLAADYDQSEIKPTFDPTDDDLLVRNEFTVTRVDGSSATARITSGSLSTDPVTGAGRYNEAATLNLHDDDQVADHATWRANIRTVDEYRYPYVNLKLHATPGLLTEWLATDVSSRVTVDNLPANMPPDLVDQVIEGYTERITQVEWDVGLNLAPYKPYKVFEVADAAGDTNEFLGRLAGDPDAAIRVAIDDNDTSIEFDPNRHRWTTTADHFDPDLVVRFGGETAEVSAISTTAATFVAAGAASHADNAAVTPAMFAGATTRDGIFVLGAIRSSGTGTLSITTGYTRLPVFAATDNVQLWFKVHDGSESDPTVTPSGGSAGDTVSAFTFGFRGTPSTLDDPADIVVLAHPLLNSSAQNIAYHGIFPFNVAGCVILLVGWKQDDYTSVAVPGGLTEILEASTGTGSDQSLYLAYQIQTTPDGLSAGSLVVTGGASAISRSATVALAAGYQTMTVAARNTNGIPGGKSHAAGTKIEVEDAFVLGL